MTCVCVEPAQLYPSTVPPLPCETHPAQRPPITQVGGPFAWDPADKRPRQRWSHCKLGTRHEEMTRLACAFKGKCRIPTFLSNELLESALYNGAVLCKIIIGKHFLRRGRGDFLTCRAHQFGLGCTEDCAVSSTKIASREKAVGKNRGEMRRSLVTQNAAHRGFLFTFPLYMWR